MRLEFVWDDETGETAITPESLADLQDEFSDVAPIHVLDFLQDVCFMATDEYNSALKAFWARAKA